MPSTKPTRHAARAAGLLWLADARRVIERIRDATEALGAAGAIPPPTHRRCLRAAEGIVASLTGIEQAERHYDFASVDRNLGTLSTSGWPGGLLGAHRREVTTVEQMLASIEVVSEFLDLRHAHDITVAQPWEGLDRLIRKELRTGAEVLSHNRKGLPREILDRVLEPDTDFVPDPAHTLQSNARRSPHPVVCADCPNFAAAPRHHAAAIPTPDPSTSKRHALLPQPSPTPEVPR